jgi:glycosyltransferase involved in cell wall biosynthesis
MRIGVLTAALGGGGGAERQAALWARVCAEQGYDVTAITLKSHEGDSEVPGVRIVRLRKASAVGFATVAWRLRRLEPELDAVVAFEPYVALCCALAGLRIPWMLVTGKVPYLLKDGSRIPMRAFRMTFDRAALASAPNQAVIDCHRDLGLRARGAWTVVPNIADPDAFTAAPTAEREGVLFVGRLVAVKNPMLAVESATAAGAPLTLLGEGELQPDIEAALAKRDGGPPVRIEYSAAPWPVYARHRVLVVTSDYESFGNVLVESLAAGTPVVSVDCDFGPRGIIGGASYSHLVAPSVESISAALSAVLERPYSDAEAAECRAIASRYRAERVAPSIIVALDRLGREGRSRRAAA